MDRRRIPDKFDRSMGRPAKRSLEIVTNPKVLHMLGRGSKHLSEN
jgi:hypothetical protein